MIDRPHSGPAARLDRLGSRHPRHILLCGALVGLLAAQRPATAAVGATVAAALVVVASRGRLALLSGGIVAAVMAGALLGAWRLHAIDHTDLAAWSGHTATLRGWLVKRERATRGVRFRMRVTSAETGGRRRHVDEVVQVRVGPGARADGMSIGAEMVAAGVVGPPRSSAGSDFDYAAYLRRAGVHVVLSARFARATGRRRGGPAGIIDAVRRRAEDGVGAGLSPSMAALARGMVLGEDERIGDRTREDFNRSGLAHVLAVSGQNVVLLALLAWPLLAAAGLGRTGRLSGTLALVALYVPLTGAGPSIVRAGVMGAAAIMAALAGRPASRWYALLLAAVVSHAIDPRAWQDAGWQLSFAAVVGIFACTPAIRRRLSRLPEPLAEGAAVTVAATLVTAPLMSFHFGRVSLAALPANLFALPAIAPVMWIGMLSAAAAQISTAPATLLNALGGYPLAYTASVAELFAHVPGAVWEQGVGSPGVLAAVYGSGAAAYAVHHLDAGRRQDASRPGKDEAGTGGRPGCGALAAPPRGRALALAGLLVAALVLVLVNWSGSREPAPPAAFAATFLDVGQGDATLIQAPGAHAVLVDGGPPGTGIVGHLIGQGVSALDAVVLTHAQEDHQGGLEEVLRALPVGLLLDGGAASHGRLHARILELAHRQGTRVIRPDAGQRLQAGGLRLRVLSPEARPATALDPAEDPNLRAIVLLASYGNLDLFLPADAESEVTAGLPLQPVEVMKVAHHGSEDEGLPALLTRLRPRAAVIEVGAGNPYGHPSPTTTRSLLRAGVGTYRTDQAGDVHLTLGDHGPLITTANERP